MWLWWLDFIIATWSSLSWVIDFPLKYTFSGNIAISNFILVNVTMYISIVIHEHYLWMCIYIFMFKLFMSSYLKCIFQRQLKYAIIFLESSLIMCLLKTLLFWDRGSHVVVKRNMEKFCIPFVQFPSIISWKTTVWCHNQNMFIDIVYLICLNVPNFNYTYEGSSKS